MRKQALILLAALLSFNPFAPQLPEDKFAATLKEYQRTLEVHSLSLAALLGHSEREHDRLNAGG